MNQFLLYIDPGTGSMLFSLCIGIATTLVFAFRAIAIKLRFILSGGKGGKFSASKIPYVIFSDHKRYWNVFKPICDEFEKRKIPLVYYTQSEDDPCLSQPYTYIKSEFIGEGNKGFIKLNFLNARVVLSTTPGLDVLQWKKSKNAEYYIHIQHSVTDLSLYRMFGLDHYDSVLLTGLYQEKDIRLLETIRGTPKKELLVTGSVYMDEESKHLAHLPAYKGPDFKNITVLVAPSWGKNAILSKFGSRFLDALLATDFKIIIRPHPQSQISEKGMLEKLMEKFKGAEKIQWNFDNDNLSVMNSADILISDFSGILFDFSLLLNRPVLFADVQFDKSEYDAAWIDHELWTFQTIRKIGIELTESEFPRIGEIIKSAINNKSLEAERKKAKEEAWQYQGKSVEKTVDYIISKGAE